jgi:hypothetical protein
MSLRLLTVVALLVAALALAAAAADHSPPEPRATAGATQD